MAAKTSKPRVILCLGGAFNPPHTRHVEAMVLGKKWLETNTEYEVVAGRLAVSTDGYLQMKTRKSGDKCIKATHRIKLCELACNDHSDWLAPYNRVCGSAAECGQRVKLEMSKINKDIDIHIAVIVGADRAMNKSGHAKWHKDSPNITVCIGRTGETAAALEKFKKDHEEGRVKNKNFFFVEEELENISSTTIRKHLKELENSTQDKTVVIDQLVKDGMITDRQGEYILDHETELYFDTLSKCL